MDGAKRQGGGPGLDWAAVLMDQASSGETIAAYCRVREINYKQFQYRRRKARKSKALMAAEQMPSKQVSSFIPIKLPRSRSVVLRLPSGIELGSDDYPDVDWLVDLSTKLVRRGVSPC